MPKLLLNPPKTYERSAQEASRLPGFLSLSERVMMLFRWQTDPKGINLILNQGTTLTFQSDAQPYGPCMHACHEKR